MAARNTTQGKPATAHGAMTIQRFYGVRGAAWIITARGRKERRQRDLVTADKQDERCSHRRSRHHGGAARAFPSNTLLNGHDVAAQSFNRGLVRLRSGPNGHVHGRLLAQRGQQNDADHVAKTPFETIPIHSGVLMPRYNDTNARRVKGGSEDPHIEMHGPDTLPLANDGLYVEASRQPVATRISEPVVTRLRTCSEV